MSEDDKTRAAAQGIKFSEFKQVTNQEGNPVQVVGLRDGENIRAVLTTDLVATEPEVVFRNSKGQFAAVDPGLLLLDNQLKVNRYFYNWMLEQGVTIDPAPPVTPADGALWFDNSEDVMQLFMWHEESDAWLPVAPPTTLEGRVEAGETTQAAIIAQIQESLEDQAGLADRIAAGETEQSTLKNKVNALEGVVGEYSLVFTMDNSNPRAGEFNLKDGAMQVTNTLASADYITLSDTDSAGNAINLDRITEGDVLRFSSVDGQAAEIKITDGTNGFFAFTKVSGELDRLSDMPYQFILLSSFDPAGLATVDYVDAQDEANRQYVDNQIAGIDFPEAVAFERPMLWKYNPGVSANNLGNGEFNLSSGPTNGGAGEWSIYFAKRDANGQHWYPHDLGHEYTHEIGEQLATIRGREQVCVHGKTRKWYFNQGTNKYAQLKLTYYRSSNALGTGKYHLITIPGYMPYFTFSTDAQTNGTHR